MNKKIHKEDCLKNRMSKHVIPHKWIRIVNEFPCTCSPEEPPKCCDTCRCDHEKSNHCIDDICLCHKSSIPAPESEKGWEGGFRVLLMELDDYNLHLNNKHEPIKGDIFFDGIEVEQFIRSLLAEKEKQAYKKGRAEVKREVKEWVEKQKTKDTMNNGICNTQCHESGKNSASRALLDKLDER